MIRCLLYLITLAAASSSVAETYNFRTGNYQPNNELFVYRVATQSDGEWSQWIDADYSNSSHNSFTIDLPLQSIAMEYDHEGTTRYVTFDPPQEYLLSGGASWNATVTGAAGGVQIWQGYSDSNNVSLGSVNQFYTYTETDLVAEYHASVSQPQVLPRVLSLDEYTDALGVGVVFVLGNVVGVALAIAALIISWKFIVRIFFLRTFTK